MKLCIYTTSFLNDLEEHSKWLYPYYASLKEVLKSEDVEVIHVIIQNDWDKKLAQKNINNIKNSFDLDFYESYYIDSEIGHVSGTGNHHGRALGVGIKESHNISEVLDCDYFLVEEFDLIHRKGYWDLLKKFVDMSLHDNFFIGSIYPGVNVIDHPKLDGVGVHVKLPRIYPHFLGFPRSELDYFKQIAEKFESKFNNRLSGIVNNLVRNNFEDRVFWIASDTATDLYYELVENKNFLHLKDFAFIHHISGITATYNNILKSFSRNDVNYDHELNRLNQRYCDIKNKYDYLNFENSEMFSSERFEHDFQAVEDFALNNNREN